MYEEYLEYVKQYLISHNGLYSENKDQTFRSRYDHTKRVIKWLDIISEGMEVDREALYLAAVFHDIGYEDKNRKEHGIRGAKAFREFAKDKAFSKELVDKVADMIELHSDKSLLGTGISMELTLLMEADQMDEEGTMRVMWDCLVQGKVGATSYEDAYERMIKFQSGMPNKMVTPRASEIWEQKRNLYLEFMRQLESDLFVGDENIYLERLKREKK